MITRRNLFAMIAAAPAAAVTAIGSKRWTKAEVCRMFRVPYHLITDSPTVLNAEGVVAAWNRCLSAREVATFHRNPFAMFRVRGRAI